jgi:hypothetical protein
MIAMHRTFFALILTIVFLKGAIDAGRQDLLNQLLSERLTIISIEELTNIKVHG